MTAWLIWSRNMSFGYWFATSQCIAWSLGTASYYALPTLGPGFEYPWLYKDLADTGSTMLMEVARRADSVLLGRSRGGPVGGRLRACTARSRCWWR